MKSSFDPKRQENDVSSKIVVGLERISEVFKTLLWQKAKLVGLSPIQIQLLIFIAFHKNELCNVSHLAKEFNLTKPTISDAVKVLDKKGMVSKDFSSSDSRSYTLRLTELGKKLVVETHDFALPLKKQIDQFRDSQLENLFQTMSELICWLMMMIFGFWLMSKLKIECLMDPVNVVVSSPSSNSGKIIITPDSSYYPWQ